eukprot:COSAG06_NODE_977_length_11246_cov_599.741724_12_plen_81_part_00
MQFAVYLATTAIMHRKKSQTPNSEEDISHLFAFLRGALAGRLRKLVLRAGVVTLHRLQPEKTALFLSFPYVCPEPVLVKC